MSFGDGRIFLLWVKKVPITHSVSVAGDLPHLKGHRFSEAGGWGKSSDVQEKIPGRMHIRKGVWDHCSDRTTYRYFSVRHQSRQNTKKKGKAFNIRVLFYSFISNAKFRASAVKFVNLSAIVGQVSNKPEMVCGFGCKLDWVWSQATWITALSSARSFIFQPSLQSRSWRFPSWGMSSLPGHFCLSELKGMACNCFLPSQLLVGYSWEILSVLDAKPWGPDRAAFSTGSLVWNAEVPFLITSVLLSLTAPQYLMSVVTWAVN